MTTAERQTLIDQGYAICRRPGCERVFEPDNWQQLYCCNRCRVAAGTERREIERRAAGQKVYENRVVR